MEYTDERILETLRRMRDRSRPKPGMAGGRDLAETRRADNIVFGSLLGRRVRLVMGRELTHRVPGDEGTVTSIDDLGHVWVDWDRGHGWLVPGMDRWEWLEAPPRPRAIDEEFILEALLRMRAHSLLPLAARTRDNESIRELHEEVEEIVKGRRVRLVVSTDQSTTHRVPGEEGTVTSVGNHGVVFVRWDRAGGFGLLPGADRWEWL
jgi:hypothetical protein